ncbi:MAG: putative Sulfite:cytochrome c oxidoreductase, subunit B [Nitrospira sp.]
MRAITGIVIICGLLAVVLTTAAQEDDNDSIAVALAPRGEGLIVARCTVCHSEDLITQQRLPRERWEAIIEKMEHWGAQISRDETGLLVRYLSARYHPGAPEQLAPIELGTAEPLNQEMQADGPLVGVTQRGAGIFEHNCQACHGAGAGGGMGPKLAGNPILKHEDLFWETVLHGRGPMPAWGSVLSMQDIADVHAWLAARETTR